MNRRDIETRLKSTYVYAYETTDGKQFLDQRQAMDHEEALMIEVESWEEIDAKLFPGTVRMSLSYMMRKLQAIHDRYGDVTVELRANADGRVAMYRNVCMGRQPLPAGATSDHAYPPAGSAATYPGDIEIKNQGAALNDDGSVSHAHSREIKVGPQTETATMVQVTEVPTGPNSARITYAAHDPENKAYYAHEVSVEYGPWQRMGSLDMFTYQCYNLKQTLTMIQQLGWLDANTNGLGQLRLMIAPVGTAYQVQFWVRNGKALTDDVAE